ncbi:MAG TPA: Gfo/Idh/MocA family oxidoreductase [Verrucomicrobiales bacterium]|nr:Gfo/Idh/MocA family oxidoreductase [Verrucomicrobiales bacterium]
MFIPNSPLRQLPGFPAGKSRFKRFGIITGIMWLAAQAATADLRLGIIGLDTSHAPAFTELLNNSEAKDHVPGARVVAAYPGGSADIESSANRVEGYTAALRDKFGVRICESIEAVCAQVDAVLIESVDGRPHLEQARAVIAAGKPLYIDKPLAGTLSDALEIFRLAKEADVPVFSSSSLRFGKNTLAARNGTVGRILHAELSSPAHLEPHHPDLFWYGVHGCEALFTVMGTGCRTVQRQITEDGKIVVVGKWEGGRVGIFREGEGYSGRARGEHGEMDVGQFDGYRPLVVEIVKFFQTQKPPVASDETIELFAFMEAADESKRRDGAEVSLQEVLENARNK